MRGIAQRDVCGLNGVVVVEKKGHFSEPEALASVTIAIT